MLQLSPQTTILVARKHADFRKGIDGLAAICRNIMLVDPFSGTLFLFYNRNKTSFKILAFDGQGMWLIQKRLSKGSFKHIYNTKLGSDIEPYITICHKVLSVLINNGDPVAVKFPQDWRKVQAASLN